MRPDEVALIFDLDNTLLNSNIDFLAVRHRLIDLLERSGAAARPRDALVPLALSELVALGAAVSASLADAMWEIIRKAELAGLAGATLAAQAPVVLETFRTRGFQLALLTNNASEMLAEVLAAFGLAQYFRVVAARDTVPALKPAPDGIRYVLAQLSGVRCAYMIGDAWIDARAAEAAGVKFIGVGPRRDAVQARGIPIWAWADDLSGLLTLDLSQD